MSQAANWGLAESGPMTPVAYSQRGNASLDALLSGHLGSSRPAYATAGMQWVKDTGSSPLEYEIYLYDGTDDILIGTINVADDEYTPVLNNVAKTNTVNTFSKTQTWTKGSDVASASSLTLGDGNYFDVTGTVTVTAIATKGVGTVVKLHFDASLTLTHNASSFVLPGGSSITTAANDEAEFIEFSAGFWRCTNYTKADGTSVAGSNVDQTARDMATSAYIKADIAANDPAGVYGSFISDGFLTDSLAVSTNATYDSVNDLYYNPGASSIDTSGTASSAYGGTPANANDNNTGTTWNSNTLIDFNSASAAQKRVLIIDFGSNKSITQVVVDNVRFVASGVIDCYVQTSTDGTSYTNYGAEFSVTTSANSFTRTGNVTARYVAFYITGGDFNGVYISLRDLLISVAGTPANMTLQSAPVTLEVADPTDFSTYFRVEDVDAVTDGVDRVVEISIDGGTTWEEATITALPDFGSTDKLIRCDADVSGQSGDEYVWRLSTANNKEQKIKHVTGTPGY